MGTLHLEGDWLGQPICLSYLSGPIRLVTASLTGSSVPVGVGGVTLNVHRCPVAKLTLSKLLSKPIRIKAKQCRPLRKALSAVFCSSYNEKMPPRSDRTAAAAAATLNSVELCATYGATSYYLCGKFTEFMT